MKHIYYTITFMVCMLTARAQTSQTFINKLWDQQSTNEVDTIDWSATVYSDEAVYVVGNTTNGFTTDVLVTKFKDGTLQWSQTHDGAAGLSDYGTAGFFYNDRLYVCATTFESTTNLFDYTILVYDSDGNLSWNTSFNGSGSGYDIPTAIEVDENGNIYVSGASQGDSTDYDYWTMKLDGSGNLDWEQYYDYAALSDVPVTISLRSSSLTVAGVSAADSTNWDIYLINYTDQGTYVDDRRVANSGVGRDGLTALARDAQNNYYLTGRVYQNTDYEILTLKLDSFLNILWDTTYINPGYNDIGNDINVDAQGNIYVCGSLGRNANISKGITLSYDNNGSLLWQSFNLGEDGLSDCSNIKLALDGTDNLTVVSHSGSPNGYVINLKGYDQAGNILWDQSYKGSGTNDNIPKSAKYDNGILYVSYRLTGATNRYSVMACEFLTTYRNALTDSTQVAPFIGNQLIVMFSPELVDPAFVNDRDWEYGAMADILPDSVIDEINDRVGYELDKDPAVKLIKVYDWFTFKDTLSIDRLGDTIVIDKIWSTLIMTLPGNLNILAVMDSLNTLDTTIKYAEPNYLAKADTDPYLDENQFSLVFNPTFSAFPDADINVVDAWNVETGSPDIRVGVVDAVIFWGHEDFGDGTWEGSKVVDGKYFVSGAHVSTIATPNDKHGTNSAGIIGAIRDNEIGIAGIAGGDADDNNTGVSLYSLGIIANDESISLSDASSAIVFGSVSGGYGLHVQNHSWGGTAQSATLGNAVKIAYDNRCVFVASRGNKYPNDNFDVTDPRYPSCFHRWWVVNVGASGNDGQRKLWDGSNGDVLYQSMYGENVDVIAPGSTDIVLSTTITGDQYETFADDNYSPFSGTSSAAPHVSGVAGLILSRHRIANGYPNDLDDQDVQRLLQNHATPVNGQTFYQAGHGLLNAGETLQMIDAPSAWVQHSGSYTESVTQVSSDQQVEVVQPIGNVSTGTYFGDMYKVVRSYVIPIAYGASNVTVLDFWLRHATGIDGSNLIDLEPWGGFTVNVIGSGIHVTVETYCWHLEYNILSQYVNTYVPSVPNQLQTEFSVHVLNNAVGIEGLSVNDDILLYPNPASDRVFVNMLNDPNKVLSVDLTDVTGKLVKSFDSFEKENDLIVLDVTNMATGMYIARVRTEKQDKYLKLVIGR